MSKKYITIQLLRTLFLILLIITVGCNSDEMTVETPTETTDDDSDSDVINFTVSSFEPSIIQIGRELQINGAGFGNSVENATISFQLLRGGFVNADIIEISDTAILVNVPSEGITGEIDIIFNGQAITTSAEVNEVDKVIYVFWRGTIRRIGYDFEYGQFGALNHSTICQSCDGGSLAFSAELESLSYDPIRNIHYGFQYAINTSYQVSHHKYFEVTETPAGNFVIFNCENTNHCFNNSTIGLPDCNPEYRASLNLDTGKRYVFSVIHNNSEEVLFIEELNNVGEISNSFITTFNHSSGITLNEFYYIPSENSFVSPYTRENPTTGNFETMLLIVNATDFSVSESLLFNGKLKNSFYDYEQNNLYFTGDTEDDTNYNVYEYKAEDQSLIEYDFTDLFLQFADENLNNENFELKRFFNFSPTNEFVFVVNPSFGNQKFITINKDTFKMRINEAGSVMISELYDLPWIIH